MSIFTTISNAAGSLFNAFRNSFGGGSNTAAALDYNNPVNNALQSSYNASPGTNPVSQYSGAAYGPARPPSAGYSYTPQYGGTTVPQVYSGSTGAGTQQNVSTGQYSVRSSGGGVSSGGGTQSQAPQVLSGASAQQYARSAGLNGVNLEGKTYQQADETINAIKTMQKGQQTALTSAVFSPDAISNVEKHVKNLTISLDSVRSDPWKSVGSKQENIDNLLKSTAKDLAGQFDTTEAMISAYDTNPSVQKSLDTFAQFGGSDQMLVDALNEKQRGSQGNNMSTADYLANAQGNGAQTPAPAVDPERQQLDTIMNGDKIITDEIARTANIPQQLKDRYFGDAGIWQQRINLETEKVNLLKEKIADAKASAREQASYQMEKNNAELAVAEGTIEQNRVNAKNYLTGMLAKLGALNTTSAAADGITFLDQKYQQQSSDVKSKVRFANQEIQITLNKRINDIESAGEEKIQSIKEDLSKDQVTMLKEIANAKNDADKRIYDLTLKASDRAKKNVESYTNTARTLAESYNQQFSALVSNGLDVGKAASAINVKLPVADQRISVSARIKDPSAISYFKSLPTEFKNQWIQFASTQPQETYFTLADIQANYEPYVLEQQQKGTAKMTQTSKRSL